MGLDIAEVLLILLIASLVFGRRNLLDLPQAVLKSMKELKRQSRSQRLNPHDLRVQIYGIFGGVLFITITSLALVDVISYDKTVVVTAVVFVWLIVGFYCFIKRD